MLTKDEIREVFLAHGFTVKEGQADLKQYVYDAAYALLERAQPAAVAVVPEGWKLIAVNEGFDAFMAATHRADNKGYLPDAMHDEWAAFDYSAVQIAAAEAPNAEGKK
jgi:pyridoxine 5'-phosphate synthase PdxJ